MQLVDCCPWAMFIHNSLCVTRGRGVPLPLGLAAYCTLINHSGGLEGRGSRRCEIRHAGRSSIEYWLKMWFRTDVDVGWPRVILCGNSNGSVWRAPKFDSLLKSCGFPTRCWKFDEPARVSRNLLLAIQIFKICALPEPPISAPGVTVSLLAPLTTCNPVSKLRP
jgi:hypothetical protein